MKAFRNRVVHDYTGMDFEITFETIISEVPLLKGKIENIIKSEIKSGVFDNEEVDIAKKSKFYKHIQFDLF